MSTSEQPKVRVRTTLPFPVVPYSQREPIRTARLIARPLVAEDAEWYFQVRSDPETMKFSKTRSPDQTISETREKLNFVLPPNDEITWMWALSRIDTGENIGLAGMLRTSSVLCWPEVGYMIKRDAWGQGFTTEFLRVWMENWWALPRNEVEVEVPADTVEGELTAVEGGGLPRVPERLCAIVIRENTASRRIMQKIGFRQFKEWEVNQTVDGEEVTTTLVGHLLTRKEDTSSSLETLTLPAGVKPTEIV